MVQAASTVSRTACSLKSVVLAEPERRPTYTVTPSPLSRVCSTVSTSPSRTVSEIPCERFAEASAWVAPAVFDSSSARRTSFSSCARDDFTSVEVATAVLLIRASPRP